jgi:Ni/Fe-hydrogenase subunit HybB-like protein
MSSHDHALPLGGRIFTKPFIFWCLLVAVAAGLILYRFFAGVGGISAMSDGYPWGIWKPINVVTFTGIGAGAYGVGVLCYIFNKGEYHALVRPAVLVGAFAYTLGGTSVIVDLGRYWNSYLLPMPWLYNGNSILLEVALCVISYMTVLWVETWPALLERLQAEQRWPRLRQFAQWALPVLKSALPFVIALAILLPTMHQSSLGGLYMIAVGKEHPLWHTSLLPLLFLLSCLTMGYGSVVVLTTLLNRVYGTPIDDVLLAKLSKVNAFLLFAYVAIRVGDLSIHGKLGYAFRFDLQSIYFLVEMALFVVPGVLLLSRRVRQNLGLHFGTAFLTILGGAAYRVGTYLIGYNPGSNWKYFPSVGEILVTIGLAAIGVAGFVVIAKIFPIVTAPAAAHPKHPSLTPSSAVKGG